jgi:hypothetical protein
VHLDDLQDIRTQKIPPLRLLKPIYSPKSLGDMNNSNLKSISPCAEEAKKRSFDFNLDILKKGTDKENLEPSPGRANTPVLNVTATSPSVSPCFSSVSSRSPLSTPSSTSSSSSSDSASLTPVMSASARRRLRPSPIISEAVDGRFSPYALSPLYGTGSAEGPCKVPARRVTLSPTTTRMMMLEVLADEAATATTPRAVTATAAAREKEKEKERERERAAGKSMTEIQTSSRGRTSMSSTVSNTSSISSTSLVRSPVFSPSNPFGRGAKGAFMTPARPARSASLPSYSPTPASPNHGHSSRELRKTCSMSASDSVDDQATTIINTGTHTVGTHRSTANCIADSDGDYTPDIITGLPDMQFVRDRNPDKGKDEYLFKNCKGVTEKVSVLLKLFETHMDDVSVESDLCSSVTTVSDMDINSSHVESRFKELSIDTAKESSSLCKDSDVTSNEAVSKCIAGAVHTKVMGVTVSPRASSAIPRTRDGTTVDPASFVTAVRGDSEGECHDNSCTETFQSAANEEKRFTHGKRMFYATPVKTDHSLNAILGDRLIPQNKAAATLYEELCHDPICLAGISPLSEPPSPSRESLPRILTYAHASSLSGAASSVTPVFVTALVPVPVPVFGPCNVPPKKDRYLTPPHKTVTDTDAGAHSVFVLRSDVDGLREILCPCTTLTEDTTLKSSSSLSSSLPVSSPLLTSSTRGNYRCESNSKNGIIRSHKYSVTDAETAQDAEDKAAKRLNIRCQIAHWKYQWELVSYEAAKVARLLAD